ncbi:ShlB/FhaC/HecB family hemolysin secretion/activation protein [Thioalkalivibrio sulfidiphilus]|uniref:ShlB/FhaC/HecB family hemolysin secretion/activation protein n=1 Tax=Thioalkalivibrio sulfidiphilus TaxID=1033854 RepID=UPI003B2B6597
MNSLPRAARRALLLLSLLAMAPVSAQTPPLTPDTDPGFLLRPLERERERLEELRPEAPVPADPVIIPEEAPGVRLEGGPRFRLEGVRFNESEFLSTETLAEVAGGYVGREVDFGLLGEMVERINAIYQARGLITARAILPPQRIEQGVVTVQLVEGRLGRQEVSGATYTRETYVRARIPMEPGEVVDLPRLREDLDWFNRTGELRARAALRPGEGFGESDVILLIEEPPRHRLQLFADNQGVKSTGEYQLGAYWILSGLLGRDDRMSVYGVVAQGAYTLRADYSAAINARGGRLGGAVYMGDIELVEGPFKDLDVTGDSFGWQLQYEHPWMRTPSWRLDSILRVGEANSTSEISGVKVSDTDITRVVAGLRGGYVSGIGQWSFEQNISSGRSTTILGDSQSYLTYPGQLSFARPGGNGRVWLGTLGWQFTGEDTLPSADLFQLGGPGTVRGYPTSVIAGVRGYYLNIEMHWQWTERYAPFLFLDHGAVYGESPSQEDITGVGAGLNARFGPRWRGEAVLGHATRKVTPDQDSIRLDLRLVYDFPGL